MNNKVDQIFRVPLESTLLSSFFSIILITLTLKHDRKAKRK